MSVEFLRQIAASPLPKSYTAPEHIDAVRILRQAGLVIAMVNEPPEAGARVLAITEKGRIELLRFHYPQAPSYRGPSKATWLQIAAQRARAVIRTSRRRDDSP